jgi:hypothetical protein
MTARPSSVRNLLVTLDCVAMVSLGSLARFAAVVNEGREDLTPQLAFGVGLLISIALLLALARKRRTLQWGSAVVSSLVVLVMALVSVFVATAGVMGGFVNGTTGAARPGGLGFALSLVACLVLQFTRTAVAFSGAFFFTREQRRLDAERQL